MRDWEISGKSSVHTIKEASDRFIEDLEWRKLSPDTIAKFKILSEDLKAYFGAISITQISPDDVSKFRERWKAKPTTIRKKMERLRSFFRFCTDRKWIDHNPAAGLKFPKEKAIPKKPYEKEELEKIDWSIPLFPIKGIYGEENRARIDAFVKVLRWTGLRIRDVVELKRCAIAGEYIILRTSKNGKPVKLVMHEAMKSGLKEVKNPGEYFFWSGLGNPKSCVGDWQRTFRRLSKLSGVHIHAHRWRHTFATELLSKGVPVSEVAAILGNSSRIVEKHYSQWIEARQVSLDSAVRSTWTT
jgi:integrase